AVIKPLIGGTGPVHAFREYLGTPVVTLGCGDPESRAHSPNESIALANFVRGTKHMARLLLAFAQADQ
ncbi:MAG TPA: M20/M25/M40 family metallo-hydrolase, partial [Ktedonobacterales bacterium]|nr:M20/M25/M40 family metallo-hydrolase [Ktedonobacterales bacterium]